MDTLKRIEDMLRALWIYRRLIAHDAWSEARLAQHRRHAVERIVRHAARYSTFYARHYAGIDLTGAIELGRLPSVDKAALMDNFDDVVTDPAIRLEDIRRHVEGLHDDTFYRGRYRVVATAGTSGLRGYFVYDRPAWRIILASTLRWNRLLGLTPRLPVRRRIASIGADNPMHVSCRIPVSADVGVFRVLHIEASEPVSAMVEKLNAFRPEAILAYPSVAALLADEQLGGRLDLAPRVVSTHSEMLTAEMRKRIRAAWNTEPFDHYGLTEEPHVAAECARHAGLHIFEDLCIVEVADEHGDPVPDGTPGSRYYLTNLYNRTQPIIRYEVTDLLTIARRRCGCGRPFRLIEAIGGRHEDILYLPSTATREPVAIAPLSLEMAMDGCPGIAEYALAHAPQRIRARLVLAAGSDPATVRRAVVQSLTSAVARAGAMVPEIAVEVADRIERRRETMGKAHIVTAEGRCPQASAP